MILYKSRQRELERKECLSILRHIERDRPEDLLRAKELFASFVDPAIYYKPYPTVAQTNALNSAFSEWCLFDFELDAPEDDGSRAARSALEIAAEADDTLEELAATQFFASFWVIEQDEGLDRALLRETSTCREFLVRDSLIACRKNWLEGTVNARIAHVDGTWVTCGQCLSHDAKHSDPLPRSISQDSSPSALPRRDRTRFLRLTRDLQGINGRYVDSMRAESYWPS
jgi:hypothetical protein